MSERSGNDWSAGYVVPLRDCLAVSAEVEGMHDLYVQACEQRDDWQAEAVRLRARLADARKYMDHTFECIDAWDGSVPIQEHCTCGLREWRAAEGKEPAR